MGGQSDVTRILSAVREADRTPAPELLPFVYEELRAMAAAYLRNERADHTLQPTALVHEAYLKLVDQTRVQWQGRNHFLAVAAIAMRRILVNHAKARGRLKRGGAGGQEGTPRGETHRRVPLDSALDSCEDRSIDIVALDEALARLARLDPEQERMVELRFFGGLSVDETAQVMNVSARTVHREWALAKAWLRDQLDGAP